MAFKRDFKGFARTYKDRDNVADKVREQLDGWSNQLNKEGRIPLVARPARWTSDDLMCFLGSQDKPLNLLFFNIELTSFRSPEAFAERWACVKDFPCIKRVVFLLPEYLDGLDRRIRAHEQADPDRKDHRHGAKVGVRPLVEGADAVKRVVEFERVGKADVDLACSYRAWEIVQKQIA